MKLSIIIPTFNERDNVRVLTDRIDAAMSNLKLGYEIWFVDDSRDETTALLEEVSKERSHVHYLHRDNGRGLATAVVTGFEKANGKYLVVMDADLQHPPELLPTILKSLEDGAEVVIPSRFVQGGTDGGLSLVRKFVSLTARMIGQIAIPRLRNVSDCTGGYFGLHRSVIEGIDLSPIGWKILLEILVKGRYQAVREIPYSFQPRDAGESKMSITELLNYLRHLLRLVMYSREDRRFYSYCFFGTLSVLICIFCGHFCKVQYIAELF
ncbi:polyprenol monophosphomannose synthase [Alicyclobacillus fodiniaquatilis]|uniref:Polyprenol monophosphomannose synthase n=1 Tax=Alicyclobacillus fodiniaquatilis TaxID=1661150 RepID=A0ABW4JKJ9_9BACL